MNDNISIGGVAWEDMIPVDLDRYSPDELVNASQVTLVYQDVDDYVTGYWVFKGTIGMLISGEGMEQGLVEFYPETVVKYERPHLVWEQEDRPTNIEGLSMTIRTSEVFSVDTRWEDEIPCVIEFFNTGAGGL